jgi:hypothetical protein
MRRKRKKRKKRKERRMPFLLEACAAAAFLRCVQTAIVFFRFVFRFFASV